MGLLDVLGSVAGSVAGRASAQMNEAREYRKEYSDYSNDELKREFQKLNGKTDTQSRMRAMAVANTYKSRQEKKED